MSTDERRRGARPPAPAVFTNYPLVGVAIRGVTVQQVVAASPYRGPHPDE